MIDPIVTGPEAEAFAGFYGLLQAEGCRECGQVNGVHFNDCTREGDQT